MKTIRAMTLGLACLGAVPAWAQSAPPAMPHGHAMGRGGPMDGDMAAMRNERMAEMAAADARLDELVQKMEAAKGSRKTDAIAAVVAELVAQRKAMHHWMMEARPGMQGMPGMMGGGMGCGMMGPAAGAADKADEVAPESSETPPEHDHGAESAP